MNKLSRLTALLLALLMLFGSTGIAETAAGIAFKDFDASAYQQLKTVAEQIAEDGDTLDYPLADVQCTDSFYGEECFLDEIRAMTLEERMTHVNGLASYYYTHYRTWHESTKLLCECDHPMPAPGSEDHDYDTCPWDPDYKPEEDTESGESGDGSEGDEGGEVVLENNTLTKTVDGTTVTVSGSMPVGADLALKTVSIADIEASLPVALENASSAVSFSIAVMNGEAEWQTETALSATATTGMLYVDETDSVQVLLTTVGDENTYTTTDLGMMTVNEGVVEFSVSGSVIVTLVNYPADDDELCVLEKLQSMTIMERYNYFTELTATDREAASSQYWHYSYKHEDTKLLCECYFPLYAPGSDEHYDADCAWHPDNYVPEEGDDLVDGETSDTTEDGTSVTVSGSMPEGAKVEIAAVPAETAAQYVPVVASSGLSSMALDITMKNGENEWQPEGTMDITVSTESIGEDGDAVIIFHTYTDENGSVKTDEVGVEIISEGKVAFTLEHFSTVTLVNCSDDADICILETLEPMTVQERYEYFTNLTNTDRSTASTYYWHYSYKHEDTKLLCECEFPILEPGVSTHFDTDCAWHPDNYVPEEGDDLVDGETSDTTEDGTSVTVSGSMPEGAKVEIAAVPAETAAQYVPVVASSGLSSMALDITMKNGENEWQPEGTMDITVSTESIGKDGDAVIIFHTYTDENGSVKTDEVGVEIISEGKVSFKMNHFSTVTLVNCSDDADICILETLEPMTVQERYEYFTNLTNTERSTASTYYWHYSYKHEDTKLLCECEFPILEPGASTHFDTDCAWHPNNLPQDVELNKSTEDGTSVTVSGSMPASVSLTLASVAASDAAQYVPLVSKLADSTLSLNITLKNGETEWQPEESVEVTVSTANIAQDGETVLVLHTFLNSENNYETEEVGVYVVANGAVTFRLSSFSTVTLVNCSDHNAEICIIEELAAMSMQERCDYINDMRNSTDEETSLQASSIYWHYRATHEDTELLCECELPLIAPGASTHIFEDCPWHPDNIPTEIELSKTTTDGTSVTVSGTIPATAKLNLASADLTAVAEYLPMVSTWKNPIVSVEITMESEGAEWQPTTPVQVTVTDSTLGTDGDTIMVVHTHFNEDGTYEKETLGIYTMTNGAVTFDMDRFSNATLVNCSGEEECKLAEVSALSIVSRYNFFEQEMAKDYDTANAYYAHIITDHPEVDLLCRCYFPMYEPGSSEHYDTTCPFHLSQLDTSDIYEIVCSKPSAAEKDTAYTNLITTDDLKADFLYVKIVDGYLVSVDHTDAETNSDLILAEYDAATGQLIDTRYHIPVATVDATTGLIYPITVTE